MIDKEKIFNLKNEADFNQLALEIFHFQYENCLVYRDFVNFLSIDIQSVLHYTTIPFLPIEFFKTQTIINKNFIPEKYFQSSGTTQQNVSKHYIADISWYEESYSKYFEQTFGEISQYCIIGLLPNYLERPNSSLITMVNGLMKQSNHPENKYFLYDFEALQQTLKKLSHQNQPTIVFGVSFSLLDFLETQPDFYPNVIYIETGGMKGRKQEMTKDELLQNLQKGLKTNAIYSEYGMTELFSQAYSLEKNHYKTPHWMKILIRDIEDPFQFVNDGISGGINIIDLANVNTCSFIATQDVGKKNSAETFQISGRIDNSDIRGCSLLVV